MISAWAREAWRFGAVVLGSALLGAWLGSVPWLILVGVLVYAGWHAYNLYRLERWLAGAVPYDPPEDAGIWSAIYDHFYQLQRRNRRRKRRLAAILSEFRQSTAAMPDATVVLAPDLRIVWFNEAARRLLGLRPGTDTGQRIVNLIRHPDFLRYLEGSGDDDAVELISPADRRRVLSLRLVPYGDEQRLLLARDVTQVYELERVRRDFVANASHELRTPLTVITGYLETLLGNPDDVPQGWGAPLERMREQASRMEQILRDLLMLSDMDASATENTREEVDVPALLESVVEEGRALAGDDLTLTLSTDQWLHLQGAESELRSAFANLVVNAVKYTPSGGGIEVVWQATEDGAALEVRDDGIGIPAKEIPRITERFYRVDTSRSRARGGTGLGLAIVKHGLQRHDARLEVDSVPDRGSTFTCRFPASRTIRRSRETA